MVTISLNLITHCLNSTMVLVLKSMFNIIFDLYSKIYFSYFYSWKVEKFFLKDQILMFLIQLRTFSLARFKISESIVGSTILILINVLHDILYVNLNQNCLPECYYLC